MIRAGFHLSIAGGVYNSAAEALRHKYMAFQLFVSNPRTWKTQEISKEDADLFAKYSNGLIPFAHAPYLCNPSSPNPDVHSKTISLLSEHMDLCRLLGIKFLVVHLGSHLGRGDIYGTKRAIGSLSAALESSDKVNLLLENSSGYRNSVGSKVSQIGNVIDGVGSERVGFCFDTCHAFAAGYDLRKQSEAESLSSEIIDHIGEKRLQLVHLNDAKYGLGSGLDRHWHIGKGHIGYDGFKNLFMNPIFRKGNFVMETPIEGISMAQKANMRALERILSSCGLKAN